MQALVFDGELRLEEIDEPVALSGEALIRVRKTGICGTDLAIVRGYAGFRGVLGHEMVGIVEACDDAPTWVGRRVVAEINVACGRCSRCLANLRSHCERRTVLGIRGKPGVFAAWITLPITNLHEVPLSVSDDQAVFAEPIAAAFRILEQVAIDRTTEVAIFGDGRLGLLVTMVLLGTGCRVTLIGRHPHKLGIAERLGAEVRLFDAAPRARFDVVVDATGSAVGSAAALEAVRPCGVLVLKSTLAEPPSIDWTRIVVDEIQLLGSRCGPFAPALRALSAKQFDPSILIDRTFPLSEGVVAFAHALRHGALKVLIEP